MAAVVVVVIKNPVNLVPCFFAFSPFLPAGLDDFRNRRLILDIVWTYFVMAKVRTCFGSLEATMRSDFHVSVLSPV